MEPIVFPELIHRKIGRYLIKKINKLYDLKWLIENEADLIIVKYGIIERNNPPGKRTKWLDNPEIMHYKFDPIYLSSIFINGIRIGDNYNDLLSLSSPLYTIDSVPIDQTQYFVIKIKKLFNYIGTEHIFLVYQNLLSNKVIPKRKNIPVISVNNNFITTDNNNHNFKNYKYLWSRIKIGIIERIRYIYQNRSLCLILSIGSLLIGVGLRLGFEEMKNKTN